MRPLFIRGVLLFAAGAGCATVIAGGRSWWSPPETTLGELTMRVQRLNREAAELAVYVTDFRGGQVAFDTNPSACPPTPDPDVMIDGAVNPVLLAEAVEVMVMYNNGLLAHMKETTKVSPPCEPRPAGF